MLVAGLIAVAPAANASILILPEGSKIIGDEAFRGDTSLDAVLLPEGIQSIEDAAFVDSSLEEINFPASLEYIAANAFAGTALKTVRAERDSYGYWWALKHRYIIPVTSIALDASSLTLDRGDAETLVASVQPADATLPDVLWSSSDPGVATVDEKGSVLARTEGVCVITAETVDGGLTAFCTVQVAAIVNDAPDITNCTTDNDSVSLKWTAVENALSYTVTAVRTDDGWTQSYTATAASWSGDRFADGTYAFTVAAVGDDSVADNVKISEARIVTVSTNAIAGNANPTIAVNGSSATLTWAAVPNASWYEIELYSGSGYARLLNEGDTPVKYLLRTDPDALYHATTYTFTGLNPGVYVARVAACNPNHAKFGRSAGFVVGTATDYPIPEAPTPSVSVSGSTINLAWNAVDNATVYNVTLSNQDYVVLKAVRTTENHCSFTDLASGVYIVSVAAVNAFITGDDAEQLGGYRFSERLTVTIGAQVVPVTGIRLDLSSMTLEPGLSRTLLASVEPANATAKGITWLSSNEAVATVGSAGCVTAHSGGTAVISATTLDGEKTASCTVTVPIAVTGILLNKSTLNLHVGGMEALTATVLPSNATDKTVVWSSSSPSVASVNASTGLVTAHMPGTAVITASAGDCQQSCTVNVEIVSDDIPASLKTVLTSNYIKVRTVAGENRAVYTTDSLETRGNANGAYDAYTSASDEIYLRAVSVNGAGRAVARVEYPASGVYTVAYMPLSDLVPGAGVGSAQTAKQTVSGLFDRPGGTSYGSVSRGDTVYTLSEQNGYRQVLYPISGAWKIAWATSSQYTQMFSEVIVDPDSIPTALKTVLAANYIKVRTAAGENRAVYTTDSLETRGNASGAYDAYTSASDEIYLRAVSVNGAGRAVARVEYPASGVYTVAYMPLSDLVPGAGVGSAQTAKQTVSGLLDRPGGTSYGSVSRGDTVYTLSEQNGYRQVLYPISGAWKIAWATSSQYTQMFSDTTPFIDSLKISQAGIEFIKKREGCHLYVYDDASGKRWTESSKTGYPTIGWGHRVILGRDYNENSVITQAEADALLLQDLVSKGEAPTNSFLAKTGVGARVTQQQYDALVSFFYNLGSAGPSMTQLFTENAANISGIAEWRIYNQFANYHSHFTWGIYTRRMDEARIFTQGLYYATNRGEGPGWSEPAWFTNRTAVPDDWRPSEI